MTQHQSAITNHRNACGAFSAVVAQGERRWTNPSPCSEWDARGVVEHVIGFHDELLLGPTGTTPLRPHGDPIARWAVTVSAIDAAMDVASSNDVLPALTGEVLVHTWDLAMAIGVDPQSRPRTVRGRVRLPAGQRGADEGFGPVRRGGAGARQR